MNEEVIEELRKALPKEYNHYLKDIKFDTPEDVLLWLEELVRYDIVRLKKGMQQEDDLNHEVTKLSSEVTKRLEKVIKLKRTKAEKGGLKWEDVK